MRYNVYIPPRLGEKPSNIFSEGEVNREKLRSCISSCKDCHDSKIVFDAPRFGTGYKNAKLMIVGQNPPADKERCLNGGWMIHYGPEFKRGPHEKLVEELLAYLGVEKERLFVSQVFKCPTVDNITPQYYSEALHCARKYLQYEIAWANPEVIIAMGMFAASIIAELYESHFYLKDSVVHSCTPVGDSKPHHVSRVENRILIPHPSVVGRFVTKDSWLQLSKKEFDSVTPNTKLLPHQR